MTLEEIDTEIVRCAVNPAYALYHYWTVKDEGSGRYVPFRLWPAQAAVLKGLTRQRLVVLLKARQLGFTSLVVQGYAVWRALFRPNSTILLFSKAQKEARDLIKRVRTTVRHLPEWLQPKGFRVDSSEELEFSNGSRFIAFASRSSQGDSYSASLCVVDEAALVPDLNELLAGVKPTIDAGGQLVLLSRANKGEPEGAFAQTYRAALAGRNGFWHKFLPWQSRPGRTQRWYDAIRDESVARTGSLDEVWEQYPATPDEALAARQLDKRFPLKWLEDCFEWLPTLPPDELPADAPLPPGLRVFKKPEAGRGYLIGVDPAQGNPNSDDSVSVVLERTSLEQAAVLCGKIEPGVLAAHTAELAAWFNGAGVMVERNNHGFTVLQELRQHFPRTAVLAGIDGKPGWLTTSRSKVEMYNAVAANARCGAFLVHDRDTFKQLADVEASTLNAPAGLPDDLAVGFGLAVVAAEKPQRKAGLTVVGGEPDAPISETEGVRWVPAWDCWVAEAPDPSDPGGPKTFLGEFDTEAEAAGAVRRHVEGKIPGND